MSIIFDALKRADAQRQKGQAPKLAATRNASQTSSRLRLWALASLFVLLGLTAWWYQAGPTESSAAIPVNGVVQPQANAGEAARIRAEKLATGQNMPPADLSLREAPAVVPSMVIPTDISASKAKVSDLGVNGTGRLSVPSLDTPLTGAAQFDRKAAPVDIAAAPPAPPVQAAPITPAVKVESVGAKPVEAMVAAAPVAQVPAVAQPVVQPNPIAPSAPELPSIFELDYQIRHDLPKMAVSMYVYNTQQQFRFVIIGGKRYAEGEQIESKVSISKIRADGLECEYQGTRFFYPRQSL